MYVCTPRRPGRVPCEIVGEESIDVFFERLDNALDHRPLHDRVHVEKLARQHLSHETSQDGRRLHDGLRAASLSEYVRTNNNNNNRFTALCPGLYPGEPVPEETLTHPASHHPDHHPIFISFFHLPRSTAFSLFKLRAWQSFCTTSFRVLFGLPLGLEPSASYSIHFFTQAVFFSQHKPIPSQPVLL